MNIKEIGKQRQDAHPYGTKRYYENPYTEDIIGIIGEKKFGNKYNLKVDIGIRPKGDKHIDFKVSIMCNGIEYIKTIDVKTAQKAFNLLVKEQDIKKCADILVLAEYINDDQINLVGWESKKEMQIMPKKIFSSLGYINHYKHRTKLRSMNRLDLLLKNCKQILIRGVTYEM